MGIRPPTGDPGSSFPAPDQPGRPSASTPAGHIPAPARTPATPEDFGELVAAFRQRRGLSQGQLARAARLSRTYIYHLETGQRYSPSARVARALV
ncbi:MAG TPA: helix-turn-helix domain-containing protein, partial [Ktedonobacterales bacterium]|nr:helix-turn-helix domain-containing protein [Ktedonobacterales bacterium]